MKFPTADVVVDRHDADGFPVKAHIGKQTIYYAYANTSRGRFSGMPEPDNKPWWKKN